MKNIDQETADRAQEVFAQLCENFNELRKIMRQSMTHEEYQNFKYRCLSHAEPALFEETEWVTRYSSITSLEKYVQDLQGEASEIEKDEDEESS